MQHYVIWFHRSKFSCFLVTLNKTVCVSHYYAFFPGHTIEACRVYEIVTVHAASNLGDNIWSHLQCLWNKCFASEVNYIDQSHYIFINLSFFSIFPLVFLIHSCMHSPILYFGTISVKSKYKNSFISQYSKISFPKLRNCFSSLV